MSDASGSNLSDKRVHFTRGASYLVIQNLGVKAVTIVSFAILARIISPKEMGIWVILQLISRNHGRGSISSSGGLL
jgi:hypothetical protein